MAGTTSEAKIVISGENRSRSLFGELQASMAGVQSSALSLNRVLGTLGVGIPVAGIVSMFRSIVGGLDHLNDLKDATGASVKNLSALEDIAARTGTSMDTAGDALLKLNKALNTASDPNSDAAAAFKAIGLSVDDLKKKDPVEALQEVGIALAKFADDGNKGRVVMTLLGKATGEVAPLLKDLAEAGKLTAKDWTEQAEQAERFNKELFALQKNATDAARTIAGPLLVALNAAAERFRENSKNANGFWEIFLATRNIFRNPAQDLADLRAQIASLDKTLADPLTPEVYRVALLDKRVKLTAELAALLPKLDSKAGAGRGFVNPDVVKPSLRANVQGGAPKKDEITDAQKALAGYVDELQRQLDKERELTEVERAREVLSSLGTLGQVAQVRELVLGMADMAQKSRESSEAWKELNKQSAEQLAQIKAIDDALDGFSGRTGIALKQAQTARLEFRLAMGETFSQEELEAIVNGIAGITPVIKEATDDWTEFATQAARNIQDALGQTIADTLSGDFQNIGQMWKNLLIRMASEAAAAQIGAALFGGYGKGGNSDIGGLFGDILKLVASSSGGGLPLPSLEFASGGIFGAGGRLLDAPRIFPFANGIGVAGEAGPEAIMPLKRGKDGKLGVAAQGGTGTTVQVTYAPQIHVDSRADRAATAAVVSQAVQQSQRDMIEYLQARGMLN